ncbi:unnamed protein product [Heligmosomoides polygyrus]|uniref:UBX domain-containing protein n=1 Tax=Heligmosomoides polygyrus TaxID=6339 RepID=A0A183G6W4_HELPZ|nr:unnamed protein product [Heligmosomoides polygyrus]
MRLHLILEHLSPFCTVSGDGSGTVECKPLSICAVPFAFQVQIRLPNGQRVSGKFNHGHTVGAIRNFLVTRPSLSSSAFHLRLSVKNSQYLRTVKNSQILVSNRPRTDLKTVG